MIENPYALTLTMASGHALTLDPREVIGVADPVLGASGCDRVAVFLRGVEDPFHVQGTRQAVLAQVVAARAALQNPPGAY